MNELIGINELARRLKISRVLLTKLANEGKLPYIVGKHNLRVFSVDSAIKAIEKEMEHGTKSLQPHETRGNGSQSTEMASPESD